MTNASIRQNLSAILPENWSVMHFIYFKKISWRHIQMNVELGKCLVRVPTGFQALCVHATGELLSGTIVATWVNEEENGGKHIFLTLQFVFCHDSHARSGTCSPSSCTMCQVTCTGVLLHRQSPLVKTWAVSPPLVHQHPAGCRPRL